MVDIAILNFQLNKYPITAIPKGRSLITCFYFTKSGAAVKWHGPLKRINNKVAAFAVAAADYVLKGKEKH